MEDNNKTMEDSKKTHLNEFIDKSNKISKDTIDLDFYNKIKSNVLDLTNRKNISDNEFEIDNSYDAVNFSDKLKTIGNKAFYKNNLLSLQSYNKDTEKEKWNIRELKIPDSVEEIGEFAFAHNNIFVINLPKNLEKISKGTFAHNRILELIPFNMSKKNIQSTLPDKLSLICDYAFYCNRISRLILSKHITNIGRYAFCKNDIRGKLNLNDNIETIGEYAFCNNNIDDVYLSINLKEIKEFCFYLNKIINLYVPDNILKICDGAFMKNSLKTVDLGNGVEEIGKYTFAYNGITQLKLNEGLKIIREGSFSNNIIDTLIIPSSVKIIEKYAFFNTNEKFFISSQIHPIDYKKHPNVKRMFLSNNQFKMICSNNCYDDRTEYYNFDNKDKLTLNN